ncbi:unnamed protein product [Gongylonema pulchrum]|uniref:Transposase n=1 Tax=Gongylonema pulchrum TaxID=637853 RepID=A0A183EJC4_9BILA|nr:unnamed protein product [Gongylonema pulchrum]
MKCISELHLNSACIVRVDTAGIVQQRSPTGSKKQP